MSDRSLHQFNDRARSWMVGLVAIAACLICGSGQAALTICELSPSSLSAEPSSCANIYQLQIRGVDFNATPQNNEVYWDGVFLGTGTQLTPAGACPGFGSNAIGSILTVDLPCSLLATTLPFEAFPIVVRDPVSGGPDSNPLSFTVFDSLATTLLYSTDVPAGASGYVQTAGNSTGQGGVVATFNNGSATDTAVMTAANYTPNLVPAGLLFLPGDPDQASQLYDLQLTGNNPTGTLQAEFYYPAAANPYEGSGSFKLHYWDTSLAIPDWTVVKGASISGYPSAVQPFVDLDRTDNLSGTCCPSGGRFSVVFDDVDSKPLLDDLAGTIFTMAPTPLSATPKILWPPDHQMVKVTVDAPPGSFIVSVTSSEPERGQGRKDVGPDSKIIGPLTVKLRAERGSAEGRIYTLLVQLADGSRNIAVVQVPHDRNAHCHRKPKVHSGRRH